MNAFNLESRSSELRAVCHIVLSSPELTRKALPHINIERESIDWDGVFSNDFAGGHLAAMTIAKALWCDQITTKGDPLDRAFAMDLKLRQAVLVAIAIRWGVDKPF